MKDHRSYEIYSGFNLSTATLYFFNWHNELKVIFSNKLQTVGKNRNFISTRKLLVNARVLNAQLYIFDRGSLTLFDLPSLGWTVTE